MWYRIKVRYDFKTYHAVTTIIKRTKHKTLFSTYYFDNGIKIRHKYYVANQLFNDPDLNIFEIMYFVCQDIIEQTIK